MSMLYENEDILRKTYPLIAGVDEAGRGPLAGPVVVAACILPSDNPVLGLNDSKKIGESLREELYEIIIRLALDYSIVTVSNKDIDHYNILEATMRGMREAVIEMQLKPDIVLIDGNRIPFGMNGIVKSVIKGDGKYASIAAASILAKVTRDRIMRQIHCDLPCYNFAQNKGYPTKEHLAALSIFGVTEHHRLSYAPVRNCLSVSAAYPAKNLQVKNESKARSAKS